MLIETVLIETTAVEAVLRRAIELSADQPAFGGTEITGDLVPVEVLRDVSLAGLAASSRQGGIVA